MNDDEGRSKSTKAKAPKVKVSTLNQQTTPFAWFIRYSVVA
jgi:hypothetical protein